MNVMLLPTPQTPTPETDAAMKHMDATPELLKLARKLERERDEARQNAMTVGLERDRFTEQIVNLQRLNDNQRIQLVNLQNECALNNNAAQTWDKLTLEAELTQLRKVCDDQHKLITKNDEWHKEYDDYDGYPDSQLWEEHQKCMADYSTLPHVIKAKDENSANV